MARSGCTLRNLLFGCLTVAVGFGGGCSSDAPATVLLTIRAAGALSPDELRLSVFDANSRVVDAQRLPADGAPTLPATVVLYPANRSGELRLLVHARVNDAVVAEGVTRVELKSGAQVLAEVTLLSGRLADADGDDVPDDIDRCPTLANPMQGPCEPDAGLDGPGADSGDGPRPDGPRPDGPRPDGPMPDGPTPDLRRDVGSPPDLGPDSGPCGPLVCPLGCNAVQKRCNRVAPSGSSIGSSDYAGATAALVLSGSAAVTIVTNTGEIKQASTVLRPAGVPGVSNGIVWRPAGPLGPALLMLDRLTVPSGTKLLVSGSAPLLIYARSEMQISGELRADAVAAAPGAGGSAGGAIDGNDGASCAGGQGTGGSQAGTGFDQIEAGGGGGGLGGQGGTGGDAFYQPVGTAPGGQGGAAHGAVTMLLGGCGGGAGGGPDTGGPIGHGGYGGGGGGALQLVVDGKLTVDGVVTANGAGGGGGINGGGGGGGGSGGTLLIDALQVSVGMGGFLAATGGGGGAGSENLQSTKVVDGQDGLSTKTGAAGGVGTGFGGSGGAGGADSENGEDGAGGMPNAGGGGGAAGRIRVHAQTLGGVGSRSAPKAATSTNVQVW